MIGEHLELELGGARVRFTTRRGGFSTGPYESLNLGRFTDDDPAIVQRNRDLLEAQLGVALVYGRQVHGSAVRRVVAPGQAAEVLEADGQATSVSGLAPMVLSADCLPIALAGAGAVAMLHAGWRGLAAGIIPAGVAALHELGVRGELCAAIGPGAGRCCYEVDDSLRERFSHFGPAVQAGRNLDLKAIARIQLQQSGVAEVHDAELCTICGDPALFFSHRRDGAVTGRQAGIAWLK